MKELLGYAWPGNVRELQNIIERAVVLTNSDQLDQKSLILPSGAATEKQTFDQGLKEAVTEFKMAYITEVIARCGGNQRKASELLKIQPSYLSRLLHQPEEESTN
jgi:Nif-specific regulatory protein